MEPLDNERQRAVRRSLTCARLRKRSTLTHSRALDALSLQSKLHDLEAQQAELQQKLATLRLDRDQTRQRLAALSEQVASGVPPPRPTVGQSLAPGQSLNAAVQNGVVPGSQACGAALDHGQVGCHATDMSLPACNDCKAREGAANTPRRCGGPPS
jgi:multidrug efflux pump subunit AcrA (membrane-fusion protein)